MPKRYWFSPRTARRVTFDLRSSSCTLQLRQCSGVLRGKARLEMCWLSDLTRTQELIGSLRLYVLGPCGHVQVAERPGGTERPT